MADFCVRVFVCGITFAFFGCILFILELISFAATAVVVVVPLFLRSPLSVYFYLSFHSGSRVLHRRWHERGKLETTSNLFIQFFCRRLLLFSWLFLTNFVVLRSCHVPAHRHIHTVKWMEQQQKMHSAEDKWLLTIYPKNKCECADEKKVENSLSLSHTRTDKLLMHTPNVRVFVEKKIEKLAREKIHICMNGAAGQRDDRATLQLCTQYDLIRAQVKQLSNRANDETNETFDRFAMKNINKISIFVDAPGCENQVHSSTTNYWKFIHWTKEERIFQKWQYFRFFDSLTESRSRRCKKKIWEKKTLNENGIIYSFKSDTHLRIIVIVGVLLTGA